MKTLITVLFPNTLCSDRNQYANRMQTTIRKISWHIFCILLSGCYTDTTEATWNYFRPTSTVGQMAKALCACRLWASELDRESSYSEILSAPVFPQLQIGAKENLQTVLHEMCSVWNERTKSRPQNLSPFANRLAKVTNSEDIYWRFLFNTEANCILSSFHQMIFSSTISLNSHKHNLQASETLSARSILLTTEV